MSFSAGEKGEPYARLDSCPSSLMCGTNFRDVVGGVSSGSGVQAGTPKCKRAPCEVSAGKCASLMLQQLATHFASLMNPGLLLLLLLLLATRRWR